VNILDGIKQIEEIINILIDIDKAIDESADTYLYLLRLDKAVSEALNSQAIYGDVRKLLTDTIYKYYRGETVEYGLIAARLCLYLD
jgi:hypothetical protein